MKNKTVLVTGGMGGIGTAICRHFAQKGLQVVASYNRNGDHAAAKAWQKKQKAEGYLIDIYFVDVKDFESCREMVKSIEIKFGSIDVLVNNAGITRDRPLYKMDLQEWQDVMKTNLDSIFNVTRNVINGMVERKYGRIINTSSINGQKGQYGQTNYAAAKAGIHGFTKSLAQEVARKGITVNTVSPGYINTKMIMALNEDIRNQIIAQIPMGRFGEPEEIAHAIGFLAQEESAFITGTNLTINGGQYLL